MSKKLNAEEKAAKDAEREASAPAKGKKGAAEPVTIETAIRDIDVQFSDYIKNVGDGVMQAIYREVRKMAKEGIHEDKVDGTITLRMSKEGLKLSLVAKTQVVVKEVQKDEFAAITADPKQPELPLNGNGKKEEKEENGKKTITGVDTVVPPTETTNLAPKDTAETTASDGADAGV